MKYGLSEETHKKIKEIIQKYPQYKFKLFGSRSRGDYKKESDIDIVVEGNVLETDKINIQNEFDLLNIPYTVDILFLKDLNKKELIENIEKEGVLYE